MEYIYQRKLDISYSPTDKEIRSCDPIDIIHCVKTGILPKSFYPTHEEMENFFNKMQPFDALIWSITKNQPFITNNLPYFTKRVIERGADISDNLISDFLINQVGIGDGFYDNLKFLTDHGLNIEAKDKDGCTILMRCSYGGDYSMIKLLIEKFNADINAKDGIDWTALSYAVESGDLKMVKFLVSLGADVNFIDKNNWTLLIRAVNEKNLEIVKYLVEECKVNINHKDNDGKTAIVIAVEKEYHNIYKYLKEHGAKLFL